MVDVTQIAGPSSEPLAPKPAAQEILSAVLNGSPAAALSANKRRTLLQSRIRASHDTSPADLYAGRLEGRKLQLSNPDRPRPKAGAGSVADGKLRRREARVVDRATHLRRAKGMGRVKASKVASAENKRVALSRSQRKKLGLEGVDEGASFDSLQPLHRLWSGYMHQLLGLVDADGRPSATHASGDPAAWNLGRSSIQRMQGEVQKADLSGALVRVAAAGNPSLVGTNGLIVKETENTFIVAPRGGARTRTIPKHNLTLNLLIPLPPLTTSSPPPPPQTLEFQLHGNQMSYTMPFRATRKFKQKTSIHF